MRGFSNSTGHYIVRHNLTAKVWEVVDRRYNRVDGTAKTKLEAEYAARQMYAAMIDRAIAACGK